MNRGTLFDMIGERAQEPIERPELPVAKSSQPDEESQLAFMEMAAQREPLEGKISLEGTKDFGKNILKALIKGTHKLGRMIGPTIGPETFGKSEQQIQEEYAKQWEELLPSGPGGAISRTIERTLEEGPSLAALFPGGLTGGTAARIGLSSMAEQIAEEFGAGELGQTIAGLTAFMGPDLTKKLLTTGKNADLIRAGKELGLTTKQIAPLLNSEMKQRWLSKLATRRGRTQKILGETKKALGQAFEGLKKGEETILSSQEGSTLISDLQEKLFNMPSNVREKIATDMQDLASRPINSESLINFWQDINANLGPKTKQLVNLKAPIKEALAKINPKIANQFEMANKLYGKYSDIAARLKPNVMSDILGASQVLKFIGGIAFGFYPILVEAIGEAGAKSLAREMLINPRFQQLSRKLVNSLNQNKIAAVKKITDSLIKEVRPKSAEAAKIMQSINWDEWEKSRQD